MSPLETSRPHQCTVIGSLGTDGRDPARFAVGAGQRVLLEMVRRNVRAVPVGCRGGGCGVCRVRVIAGDYETLRMSSKHVSADEAECGIALACRIVPISDLVIELAPRPTAGPPTASVTIPRHTKE